jgi:hypothetical protein
MTNSNLPPGVTTQMLPGCTQADADREQLLEIITEQFDDTITERDEALITRIADLMTEREGIARFEEYQQGRQSVLADLTEYFTPDTSPNIPFLKLPRPSNVT